MAVGLPKIGILLALATHLMVLPISTSAYGESEAQTWAQALSQGKLTKTLRLWAELQPRYSFGNGKFTTVLVRPGLGWQFTDDLSLWLGYAWTPALNPTPRTEHRAWAQGMYRTELWPMAILQRIRMETRFLENISEPALRLRYQARFSLPIALENALQLIAYDEIFLYFNSPHSSIQAGFDQNRLFVGFFFRHSPEVALDLGYLWNAVQRPQLADTQMNHVAMVSLYWSFDLSS